MDTVTAERIALKNAGYIPTPCDGKRPILPGWQNRLQINVADIELWPASQNTGALTRNNPTFDIDVMDAGIADQIEAIIRQHATDGEVLVRYGREPKRAIPFRLVGEPFKKIRTPIFIDTNGNENKVEVLSDGQQFIVAGIHPDTSHPYTWQPSPLHAVASDKLPSINECEASILIEQFTAILRQTGWKEKAFTKPKTISQRAAANVAPPIGKREEAYGAKALENAVDEVAKAAPGERNEILNAKAYTLGRQVAAGRIDQASVEHELLNAADKSRLIKDDGLPAAKATIASGLHAGMKNPAAPLEDRANGNQGSQRETKSSNESKGEQQSEAPPPRIAWMDMSNWDNEPRPEREWAIRDRVPLKQVGLFSGEGGTGKSILEMTKDVAHVMGRDWLGCLPEPRPTFYLGAEDDENEIHIRFYDIAAHYGVTFNKLVAGGLYVKCLFNEDATLCTLSRTGKVEVTDLYRQLYQEAGDIKPINISVDTLTHAFAGNEIDRVQVYAFAMHMRRLAKVASGSVTALSHPSLAGMASGSGISGSTAWHNAFRFRMYLRGVKDAASDDEAASKLRELEFKKNQYGPLGETVTLEYRNGLYLPVHTMGGLEKVAADQAMDNLFLEMLAKLREQNRNVSHNKNAHNYAPTTFAENPKVAKMPGIKKALAQAMQRLFDAKKINVENYGAPSKGWSRIALTDGK